VNDARHRVSTGSPYERVIGISRAIRVGNLIAVTGTAPLVPDSARSGMHVVPCPGAGGVRTAVVARRRGVLNAA